MVTTRATTPGRPYNGDGAVTARATTPPKHPDEMVVSGEIAQAEEVEAHFAVVVFVRVQDGGEVAV